VFDERMPPEVMATTPSAQTIYQALWAYPYNNTPAANHAFASREGADDDLLAVGLARWFGEHCRKTFWISEVPRVPSAPVAQGPKRAAQFCRTSRLLSLATYKMWPSLGTWIAVGSGLKPGVGIGAASGRAPRVPTRFAAASAPNGARLLGLGPAGRASQPAPARSAPASAGRLSIGCTPTWRSIAACWTISPDEPWRVLELMQH